MHYLPHDYQTYVSRYIIDHEQAAIFLGMGLGKTVSTLTAINELMLNRFQVAKTLIIAPLRVANHTWPAEATKWDHLTNLSLSVVTGSETERLQALHQPAHVYVINRENVPWLVTHYGKAWPFDMVVLDELSSFKSHQAKRFKALARVRPLIHRIVGLTGTPASNGLMDLYAEFRLLDGGQRLGKYITHYRERYFTPDKRNGMQVYSWKLKPGAEDEIYERIADMTVSMKTTDHLRLPELTSVTCEAVMGEGAERAYGQLRRQLTVQLGDRHIDALNAASLAGKLSQLASGAIYDQAGRALTVHSAKIDVLQDLIEQANGQPILIAYWFKHDLARIQEVIPEARELTDPKDFTAWNAGRIPIALIHPASAGHGLNLQAGGHLLVWFTIPWSLELYEQTNARLYRQGQTQPVTISHIVTKGTIDEQIMAALERKAFTQTALIDAVKTMLKGEQ
ncbi:MAG: DEAD/DEAH box helicase [Actinomycetaceae bacterium]|nr:DEAD/DEAH box helicase [Arcanobacterium sp.]MDD7505572.1 DEAD/DEAH box helicase [Actinomycetaceae bacterium]MDY6143809.1 DEAD/DEAH box helicase [Arcanobacterium sp.]